MELSDLTAYAAEKYNIPEKHLWADLPGFSVLADPGSGRWLALLMREWDYDAGEELQHVDIKCGSGIPAGGYSYLARPFRMKGSGWVGVVMGRETETGIVRGLFDKAVVFARSQLLNRAAENEVITDRGNISKDTVIQYPGQSAAKAGGEKAESAENYETAAGSVNSEHAETSEMSGNAKDGRNAAGRRTGRFSENSYGRRELSKNTYVPPEIREMRRRYIYGSGSFAQKCMNFRRQGKFMENYEDDYPWYGKFDNFYPVYHDMTVEQLRGYFTWRTGIRKGIYRNIPPAMACMYIYELLNGIGTSSPEDAVQKMKAFEKGYLDSGIGDPGIRKNLRKWIFGYAVENSLPPDVVKSCADPDVLAQDQALAVLKRPGDCDDEKVFGALKFFGGKLRFKSPVIKKHEKEAVHLFADVWRRAAEGLRMEGKNLFEEVFGKEHLFPWHPMAGAVFLDDGKKGDTYFELDEFRKYFRKDGVWTEMRYERVYFDIPGLLSLLRGTDRLLREYFRTGGYLKQNPDEAWAEPFITDALEAEKQAEIKRLTPEISIDFSSLEKIREDSDATRDSLLAGEEETSPETGEAAVPSEMKKPAEKVNSAGNNAVQHKEGSGDIAEKEKTAKNRRGEEPAAAGLDPDHTAVLRMVFDGEDPDEYIREHHLITSVVADTINEALFDEAGDSVLECTDGRISLVEDYREDVAEILEGFEEAKQRGLYTGCGA